VRSNFSIINVYKKNNTKSDITTQLLYGDTFKKLETKGTWTKIKINSDNYRGYIKKKKFKTNQKNTHKISKLFSSLYSQPKETCKIKKKLSFGSKIKVVEKKIDFVNLIIFGLRKKI